VIIAGVLVINWRFATLNEELASIAVTGELARPLLESADQLTGNFNNLTGSLTNDLGKSQKKSKKTFHSLFLLPFPSHAFAMVTLDD